ncbi:hypothetical protein C8Q75DRAFT_810539 [Abortiporus biennis]|nr:hypothetical protein C8Q75DRAFT_810539 [Abortiporus biennis]
MHSRGYPSPSTSSGYSIQPVTPPGYARSLSGYPPSTPGAPYIPHSDLPPSPQTPSSSHFPRTPFIPYVPLPGGPSNGLITPPDSPQRQSSGRIDLNPILTPQCSSMVAFNLRHGVDRISFRGNYNSSVLRAPATNPPTNSLEILVAGSVVVEVKGHGPNGFVTVGDVFYYLHTSLCGRIDNRLLTRRDVPSNLTANADLLGESVIFSGMVSAGTPGPYFILYTRP